MTSLPPTPAITSRRLAPRITSRRAVPTYVVRRPSQVTSLSFATKASPSPAGPLNLRSGPTVAGEAPLTGLGVARHVPTARAVDRSRRPSRFLDPPINPAQRVAGRKGGTLATKASRAPLFVGAVETAPARPPARCREAPPARCLPREVSSAGPIDAYADCPVLTRAAQVARVEQSSPGAVRLRHECVAAAGIGSTVEGPIRSGHPPEAVSDDERVHEAVEGRVGAPRRDREAGLLRGRRDPAAYALPRRSTASWLYILAPLVGGLVAASPATFSSRRSALKKKGRTGATSSTTLLSRASPRGPARPEPSRRA
jgi:hypothetical protein